MSRSAKLVLLLVLVARVAGAQLVQEGGGTRWFGRLRTGPVHFAQLGTDPNGEAGDGTTVYCDDCLPTSPATAGGTGATCKRQHGVWDCGGGCVAQAPCPDGQVVVGQSAGCGVQCGMPVCGDSSQVCPPGQVMVGMNSACQIICVDLSSIVTTSTTTTTTTTSTTTTTTTSTTTTSTTTTTTTTTAAPTTTTTSTVTTTT